MSSPSQAITTKLSSFIVILLQLVLLSSTEASKVPAVIVFGDSSVDAGNNNYIPTIARSNFQPYGRDFKGGLATGRFSNGKIATDFISDALGVKPTIPAFLDPHYNISDFATGVTFASAGTGYDNATSGVLSVIPLWKELDYYQEYQKILRAHLGDKHANHIINDALYIISCGTNDFLENYYANPGGRQAQYPINLYQDFLVGIAENFTRRLYDLGARKISLGGVPPMGCMPLERTQNLMGQHLCVDRYNEIAMQFNGKLDVLVMKLNKELHGAKFVFSNPYFPFMYVIRRPELYGIEVTEVACCATGMFEMGYACARTPFSCMDADKYVFWDAFHPTQKTNQIIADYLVKKVLYKIL